jgi:sugar/nucleoside kinase (ribokinase family)
MRTCLGIASSLSADHLDENAIKNSSWVFLEGYLFTNGERGMQAMEKAIKLAHKYGAKVALTFSDSFIVDLFKENLTKIVKQVDLVFANEREASAFTGGTTPEESFRALTTLVPNVAMTAGPRGAFISFNRKVDHVEAYPCTPLDLTGAGDMFAGGFLYGVSQGLDSRKVARASCHLAMKVITQIGARLHAGTREGWDLSWSEA